MSVARRVAVVLAGGVLVTSSLACAAMEGVAERFAGVTGAEGEAVRSATNVAPDIAESGPSVQGIPESPQLEMHERLVLAYLPMDVRQSGDNRSRATDGNTSEWPEMLYLGEAGRVGNVTVTPQEIRIVPGRSIPMLYSPEHDEMIDAPKGSPSSIRGYLNRPGLVMPPNASLVMVRIETDPDLGDEVWQGGLTWVCGAEGTPPSDFHYRGDEYRVSYPGVGEMPLRLGGLEYSFGEYQGIGDGLCPEGGWMYFVLPGLELNPSVLWLEYMAGTEPGELAFWTLAERP